MIDIHSRIGRRQTRLMGIPSSTKADALAAISTGLDTPMITQRLVGSGYDQEKIDRLLEVLVGAGSTSDRDIGDAWIHVTHCIALAEIVFGDATKAAHWLQRDTVQFGGGKDTPLMMLATPVGAGQVEERLYQVQHGMYA